jgi:hypothetical protein
VPRYFFTIRGRNRVKDDRDGTNLPDIAAALSNAEHKIRELRTKSGYDDPTLMMIVKDEAGQTVLSLPLCCLCRFFFRVLTIPLPQRAPRGRLNWRLAFSLPSICQGFALKVLFRAL